jgi:hypothetical protein
MRLARALLVSLGGCVLGACSGDPCRDAEPGGVLVDVVDAHGATVRGARVTYQVGEGAALDAECAGPETTGCVRWLVNVGTAGQYTFRATTPDGQRTGSTVTFVGQRGCYPWPSPVCVVVP